MTGVIELFVSVGMGLYLVVSLIRGSIYAGWVKVVGMKENPARFFIWWFFWLFVALFVGLVGFDF